MLPYLKPIHSKIKINAPPEKVWEIISNPGNLEYCHPFCESNPVEKWPGKGSIDYVHYYNGLKFKRKFTEWQNGFGYELLIGKIMGRKSKVVWNLDKTSHNSAYLDITIYAHDITRYPSFTKPFIYHLIVKPALQRYISSVWNGVRWYASTNERVKKNQFGPHKWFSD
jgi:hypothetical protein